MTTSHRATNGGTEQIRLSLPSDMILALDIIADEANITRQAVIREAISRYIEAEL